MQLVARKEEGAFPSFSLPPDSNLKLHPDPFYSISSHSKFFLLRDFINGLMEDCNGSQEYSVEKNEANGLICAVISLLSDLMSFGFFSTKEKIDQVCKPMVSRE